MEHIGTLIKTARETLGIPIESIASTTKISIETLKKLENNELDKIPQKPFIIGFLTAIAKKINVAPKDIIDSYNFSLNEKQSIGPQPKELKEAKPIMIEKPITVEKVEPNKDIRKDFIEKNIKEPILKTFAKVTTKNPNHDTTRKINKLEINAPITNMGEEKKPSPEKKLVINPEKTIMIILTSIVIICFISLFFWLYHTITVSENLKPTAIANKDIYANSKTPPQTIPDNTLTQNPQINIPIKAIIEQKKEIPITTQLPAQPIPLKILSHGNSFAKIKINNAPPESMMLSAGITKAFEVTGEVNLYFSDISKVEVYFNSKKVNIGFGNTPRIIKLNSK